MGHMLPGTRHWGMLSDISHITVAVQLPSHVRLFAIPWTAAPGFPVLHHLLEFAQIHVNIHSFRKQFLSTYYVLGIVSHTGNQMGYKTLPLSQRVHGAVEERVHGQCQHDMNIYKLFHSFNWALFRLYAHSSSIKSFKEFFHVKTNKALVYWLSRKKIKAEEKKKVGSYPQKYHQSFLVGGKMGTISWLSGICPIFFSLAFLKLASLPTRNLQI